jgi:hypothetical protein
MPGGFGTRANTPRRSEHRPVESFAPVDPYALAHRGVFAGSVVTLQFPDFLLTTVREHATRLLISIDGAEPIGVGIVRQGPFAQLLFACPRCQAWRRRLYIVDRVLGCRGRACLRLDPRSRHTHRSGAARAVNLARKARERLGADPTPFSPLPAPPRHHGSRRVYDRLAAKIAMLEQMALASFNATLAAVEVRARNRRMRR